MIPALAVDLPSILTQATIPCMSEQHTDGPNGADSQAPNETTAADGGQSIPGAGPEQPGVASDDKTMALLCHLLGIFTWFLGALIIWLIKKDQSRFIDHHGKEALNFQITVGIAYIAAGVITCLTLGIGSPLTAIVWVVNLVFCILATVAANNGQLYRYPISIRLVK